MRKSRIGYLNIAAPVLLFLAIAAALAVPSLARASGAGAGSCHANVVADGETPYAFSGVVIRREVWGPPAYGMRPKTDSKIAAWILKLDSAVPITLLLDFQTERPVTLNQIQLHGPLEKRPGGFGAYAARHVVVDGTLSVPSVPSDLTDAVINGKRVMVTPRIACASDAQSACLVIGKHASLIGVLRVYRNEGPDVVNPGPFWALRVSPPICFISDPAYSWRDPENAAASDVAVMQPLLDDHQLEAYKHFLGKRVRVSATPIRSDNAYKATIIVLDHVTITGE